MGVRSLTASLTLIAATAALAQTSGTHAGGVWSVTPSRALDWGGKAYLPVGLRIPAQADALARARSAGVRDVILEVGSGTDLKAIVGAAESDGMRYLIAISEPAAMAPGFVVEPSAYRIDKLAHDADIQVPLPNARSVFYLILNTSDYSIASKGWSEVSGGVARLTLGQPRSEQGYTVLLYPRQAASALPDYWEQMDTRRDATLARLAGAGFGPGLRGFVNPFGDAPSWTGSGAPVVPDSTMFRLEFEAYLRTKYKNVAQLEIAWKLTRPNLDSFGAASRLVPLFGSSRGVEAFFDIESGDISYASRYQNPYWDDVRAVVAGAAARRATRFAQAVRQVADVPVIYEWKDWSQVQYRENPSGEGIGIVAQGVGAEALDSGMAPATATALAWNSRRWLIATDLRGPFEDERQLRDLITQSISLGTKAWFVRSRGGEEAKWVATLAAEAESSPGVANTSPRAIFYPLNARYPANTMQLPGDVWWLPVPVAGDRLDLGPDYEGYRIKAPFGQFTAIWRTTLPLKTKLRFTDPNIVTIRSYDGMPLETKVTRDGIELVIDTLPILITGTDELPAPTDAVDRLRADFRDLMKEAQARNVNTTGTQFAFDDAYRGMERSPGAAYAKMTEVFNELNLKAAPFSWIEGESSFDTNFGEVVQDPAASNSRSLALSTPLKPPAGAYFARYRFQSLPEIEVAEVWVAASIPAAIRPHVKALVGDVTLGAFENPHHSGGDYAWYNLGKLTLRNGQYVLSLSIGPSAPAFEMRVDAILITPIPFKPAGPKPPRFVPIR